MRAAEDSDSPPEFNRQPRPSAVDPFEAESRRLLSEDPRMPTTVIAERIGWSRGLNLETSGTGVASLFVPLSLLTDRVSPGRWPCGIFVFHLRPVLLENGSFVLALDKAGGREASR